MIAQVMAISQILMCWLNTNPVNSEKYAAVLSVLIEEFENLRIGFKAENYQFIVIFATPFSANISKLFACF